MAKFNVAIVVGSSRRESINGKLAQALTVLAGDRVAAKFVRIDDLPIYNQDLESPLPAGVARLKAEIEQADGLLVVTPEHNRSIPALLKNAIDWAARPYGRNSWSGKPAAIIGTSPGAIGTAVAQQHLRQILGNLGAVVMGGEAYVTFRQGLVDDADAIRTKERGGSCKPSSTSSCPSSAASPRAARLELMPGHRYANQEHRGFSCPSDR